jgi:serine protease Do
MDMWKLRLKQCEVGLALLLAMMLVPSGISTLAPEHDVRRDATVNAIEQVMPSVVNIATATVVEYHDAAEDFFRQFFGFDRPRQRREQINSIGSGVIIDKEGYILTNVHVTRRATRIQVKLQDGREYEAERIGEAPNTDVALLKLHAKSGETFKAIRFAADDDLLLGETVIALGNPFGLGGTVTKGILSSKTRRPPTGNEPLNVEDWLQTDAAINPGNSGGPLINLKGELIGLNVAVYAEGHGIGFAIPMKQVSEALAKVLSPEATDSLWFGAQLKVSSGPLTVALVQPGSPAERSGLKAGDRIFDVNGTSINSMLQFNRLLKETPEHKVVLGVKPNNEQGSKTVSVRLVTFDEMVRQRLGLSLLELNSEAAARLGVRAGKGLFVEAVEKNSPAERGEVKPGYFLTEIDGKQTDDLMGVVNALAVKAKGESVHLSVVAPHRIGASFVEFRQGTVDLKLR